MGDADESIVKRVVFEMQRYQLEAHVNGTFFVQDGYTGAVVREELTAAEEPYDVVNSLNARAAIAAMREPTEAMENEGRKFLPPTNRVKPFHVGNAYRSMIDEALRG